MKNKSFFSLYQWLVIIVFFAILLIPLKTLNFDPHTINNNFYGRSRLISFATDFKLWIGDRVFPKAIVGKNGWIFYTGETNLDNYQNAIPFTENELQQIQTSLEHVTQKYAQEGVQFLFIVPPAKHSVYPEYMPGEITIFAEQSRLDQLITHLNQHSEVRILDLRPALLEEKKERQNYYATDTHWNLFGAFTAYEMIMDELSKTHQNVAPYKLSDYEISMSKPEVLDITHSIGTKTWREKKIELTPKHEQFASFKEIEAGSRKITFSSTGNENLPTAVIYYDSFFFKVNLLLAEHFEQAVFIQNYLGGGLWNLSWVDDTKPDIVIIEFSERYIQDLPLLLEP